MAASFTEPMWYPSVPPGWTMSRVKAAVQSIDSGVWGDDPYDAEGTPVVRSNEIDEGGNWRDTTPAMRALAASEREKARLRQGDLLIVKSSGSSFHIGKTAVVTQEIEALGSCFSNFTGRIRVHPHRTSSRFLWYFLNNSPGRDQLFYYGTTTTGLINLSATSIGAGVLVLPALSKQERIAAYLDTSCEAIDAAVAAKRRQLETLGALRKSIIHSVFTEKNDSPFERIKDVATKIGSGVTPEGGASGYLDSGIPLLRSQNVHFDGLRLDDVAYISAETHAEMAGSQLKPRDVLLNVTGASIGRCTFVPGDFGEGNVNQHVCIIRPGPHVDYRFLAAFLSSPMGQDRILSTFTGASRQGLSHKDLGLIRIPLPTIRAQREAIGRIEQHDSRHRQLSDCIEAQIATLTAYRKSLIHECVTGQRRVTKADVVRVRCGESESMRSC